MSTASVIRVQSSEGTKRIDITSEDTYKNLYEKVADTFSLSSSDNFILYKEQNKKSPIGRSQTKLNLRHGDMIYLIPEQDDLFSKENHFSLVIKSNRIIENSSAQSDFISKLIDIKEDDVDIQLGAIRKSADHFFCAFWNPLGDQA